MTLICVGCGRAEDHTAMCEGGGYALRGQLAAERDAEWIHNRVHLLPREDCEFC